MAYDLLCTINTAITIKRKMIMTMRPPTTLPIATASADVLPEAGERERERGGGDRYITQLTVLGKYAIVYWNS